MDELQLGRAIHVLSIVIWIGGVAFVTLTLLPAFGRERSRLCPDNLNGFRDRDHLLLRFRLSCIFCG